MTVFARVNHAALAAEAGLPLRPTEVILFGNPRGGTPLMQASQTIGIDLPLKALVWQDESGKTWLSYNEPRWLAARHGIAGADKVLDAMTLALADIAAKATKDVSATASGPGQSTTIAKGPGPIVPPAKPESGEVARSPIAELSPASLALRFVAIGVVIAGIATLFVYAGGWFSPHALTPKRLTDTFEQVSGLHPGFRRNHAKGVCVSGYFESNGQGATLCKASIFQPGRVPVIGRFSLGGGQPFQVDAIGTVRGLGIRFTPAAGEEWRTAMINLPVFPVQTPEAFTDQLLASAPDPATGKPDPAKMQAFLAKYPASAKAVQLIRGEPKSSGFDNSTFNSLNAFRFINAAGVESWVRWSVVPAQPFQPANSASSMNTDSNQLFDALIASIHQHPLQWHLIVTIGEAGDSTEDATVPWPSGRRQVDVGTLTIDQVASDDTSPARDINFDPLILPNGIAASGDPLLSARSAVYSQSFTRREGERKSPSAVSPAETER